MADDEKQPRERRDAEGGSRSGDPRANGSRGSSSSGSGRSGASGWAKKPDSGKTPRDKKFEGKKPEGKKREGERSGSWGKRSDAGKPAWGRTSDSERSGGGSRSSDSGKPSWGRPRSGDSGSGASDSGKRAYGRPTAGKPTGGKPAYGRPAGGGSRDSGGEGRPRSHGGSRDGSGKPAWAQREGRPGDRTSGSRPPRSGAPRDEDARPRHDDPIIPEDVAANQLDRAARGELKTLSKDNADWVAKHLVMAGRLIDTDAALAHKHALAAARRAGRIGVVRETTAITAYAIGEFALALRELRTYRRISGRDDQLPLMVDSERGVGRPQQALELGRSVPRASLDATVQVSLAIAMSGARLDLGQPELALTELEIPQLDPQRAFSYSPSLFDAYATVLEELGRTDEAELWWERSERATDALDAAAVPDGEDTVEIVEEVLDGAPDAPEPSEDAEA